MAVESQTHHLWHRLVAQIDLRGAHKWPTYEKMTPPVMPPGYPPAEIEINEAVVTRLVAEQFPALADLAVVFFGNGWDNAMFRLGRELAVRLPRITGAVPLLENEQKHLPALQPFVEIPIPAPVYVGAPSATFPWPWSIVRWHEGARATNAPLHPSEAPRVARFLATLHNVSPPALRVNDWRGVPLSTRKAEVMERLTQLRGIEHGLACSLTSLARLFEEATRAPVDVQPCWVHGDLHPNNVITLDGKLVSIVDWGDTTIGDRAVDLATSWMLFANEHHEAFWESYDTVSDATKLRALGWAVFFGLLILCTGIASDPGLAAAGRATLNRLAVEGMSRS